MKRNLTTFKILANTPTPIFEEPLEFTAHGHRDRIFLSCSPFHFLLLPSPLPSSLSHSSPSHLSPLSLSSRLSFSHFPSFSFSLFHPASFFCTASCHSLVPLHPQKHGDGDQSYDCQNIMKQKVIWETIQTEHTCYQLVINSFYVLCLCILRHFGDCKGGKVPLPQNHLSLARSIMSTSRDVH